MSPTKKKSGRRPHFKAILFDLGNTLYIKESFLDSAFAEVARYLGSVYKLDKQTVLALLYRIWKIRTSHYEFLFDELLQILGVYSAELVTEVLNIYHSHQPKKIKTYPGAEVIIKRLRKSYKIGLVTDGHPQMQRNKIAVLGWADLFDTIIYSMEYDKAYLKPHPFVYRLATEKLKVKPKQTMYLGDNPHDDFIGAKEIGIFTVRVLQGEFKDVSLDKGHEADINIKNIKELQQVLKKPLPSKKEREMEPD